jgi:rod shape-determining protein MreD
MTIRGVILATVLLVAALVLQVVVVNPLRLPGGSPLLPLLVVVGLAVVQGPLSGAVTGFSAGLLADLAPPADGQVGRWAVVLCLVGYFAGVVQFDARRSAALLLAMVSGFSAFAVIAYAGLGALFGDSRVQAGLLPSAILGAVGYDLLLTPFVVPAIIGLARRAEPNQIRR